FSICRQAAAPRSAVRFARPVWSLNELILSLFGGALMIRAIFVIALVAGLLRAKAVESAVVITSNDFNSFAAAIQSASSGTTFAFDLGTNSTITFAHPILIPSSIIFVGANAVTFDGAGLSSLFHVDGAGSNVSFSGCTFQNGNGEGQ